LSTAEAPAPGDERDGDRGAEAELPDDLEQAFVTLRSLDEELVRELRDELGRHRPDDVRHAHWLVGVGWVLLPQSLGPCDAIGVLVRDGEPLDRAVRPDHVHGAPGRHLGDGEPCELRKCRLVVERRAEELACVREESHPLPQRALGLVQANAIDRLRRLLRQSCLQRAALGVELDLRGERERDGADRTRFDDEGKNREGVARVVAPRHRLESRVALGRGAEEERPLLADRLAHRRVTRQRERLPAHEDVLLVAPLRHDLDRLAVGREQPDGTRPRLGSLDSLGDDRVEHLLRGDRLRQPCGDRLEPVRPG
jgi:hypothetical protein